MKFVRGRIDSIDFVSRRTRRIRISGPGLRGLDWVPGQQVRVLVGSGPGRGNRLPGPLRTYSVWDYDGGAVHLCVADHDGDDPGSLWARNASPGQEVMFTKPEGSFITRPAPYHVFAGEETAAIAIGPMLAALPPGTAAYAVIEVDTAEDRCRCQPRSPGATAAAPPRHHRLCCRLP